MQSIRKLWKNTILKTNKYVPFCWWVQLLYTWDSCIWMHLSWSIHFLQEQVILDLRGLEETWMGVCQMVLLCEIIFWKRTCFIIVRITNSPFPYKTSVNFHILAHSILSSSFAKVFSSVCAHIGQLVLICTLLDSWTLPFFLFCSIHVFLWLEYLIQWCGNVEMQFLIIQLFAFCADGISVGVCIVWIDGHFLSWFCSFHIFFVA